MCLPEKEEKPWVKTTKQNYKKNSFSISSIVLGPEELNDFLIVTSLITPASIKSMIVTDCLTELNQTKI